ncbi:Heat shock 70 kDa protein 12B [Trametes pubescens]|uniref:Heat shock 70 kDa protein 12B n=1 Tax=Trametes pubescens TaxID=154538 RepID=A0A1M2V4R7_TRAPU|nr:Heat shock 70 kDa protein 12B [Trametes pubescens]
MAPLQPYRGIVRKLVVAMDIGTTYSGVAYAFLDPGETPKIQGITRYPGQENAAGDSKIPSILYYRRDGTVHSIGAEAAHPGIELEAEDEDLVFVEWFKLHLRPETLDSKEIKRRDLPPLPEGKSVLDVFADFARYLFQCTQRYIKETHANGASMWSSIEDQIEFVLSHPNGWEGLQQGKMRQAAIIAGLIPDTPDGHARVQFVTEGEASIHFCIRSGLTSDSLSVSAHVAAFRSGIFIYWQDGQNVMIVDAGGGTVDISSYAFISTSPLNVEEIASADCLMQGSTRVNARAKTFLQEKLKDSKYGNEEDIKAMLDYFDKSTKPIFKDATEQSYIKFGSMGCNDPKVKIRRGQLLLSGSEMEAFYGPSLEAIVEAVQKQRHTATRPISTVFLVGGFAASPWLYSNLRQVVSPLGLTVCRPDTHTNKAVAEGGVSFYLEHFVSARIIKMTYGSRVNASYDRTDPEHIARSSRKIVRPSGRIVIPGAFIAMLSKELCGYRGKKDHPRWTDLEPECFTTLCTVFADTSAVVKTPRMGPNGVYYIQAYDIVLKCGLTELQAQVRWIQDGKEMRGPAKIVYDDDLELAQD